MLAVLRKSMHVMEITVVELAGGEVYNTVGKVISRYPRDPPSPGPRLPGLRHEFLFPNEEGTWELKRGKKLNTGRDSKQADNILVLARTVAHRDVNTFGYVLQEPDVAGRIDVEKCTAMGLRPGPCYRDLKLGKEVTSPTGVLIKPSDVLGPKSKGRKIAVLGDTHDPSNIKSLVMNADVLVHEATGDVDSEMTLKMRGHSSAAMAGEFAKASNVGLLVLNHISGKFQLDKRTTKEVFKAMAHGYQRRRVRDISDTILAVEAAEAFGDSACVVARDDMRVCIPVGGVPKGIFRGNPRYLLETGLVMLERVWVQGEGFIRPVDSSAVNRWRRQLLMDDRQQDQERARIELN